MDEEIKEQDTLDNNDDQSSKLSTYKASCRYIPVDQWRNPKNKVATKAFQIESKKFKDMSRETLAKWRKKERQNNANKQHKEDMSNNELFTKLSQNFECLEKKLKDQDTKIDENHANINLRVDKIEENIGQKENQDNEKIKELELRLAILEEENKKREEEELTRMKEREK